MGCDNHPVSRFSYNYLSIEKSTKFSYEFYFIAASYMSAPCKFPCRQEVMDLVNGSGKFSEKFEAFTGKLPSVRERRCIQNTINDQVKK